ncbi:hypothetical protein PAHAL_8G157800 [Panicum hallii]|uniref:Uncharacterized protein n=1 Tax=Panicum hallii TaxID=206008 RepID=A0A2T8I908_9POAL|nr:hypothetical protein PAHAL_8G157800 [Panicum hallii]
MWSCPDEKFPSCTGPSGAIKTQVFRLIQFRDLPSMEIPLEAGGAIITKDKVLPTSTMASNKPGHPQSPSTPKSRSLLWRSSNTTIRPTCT